jgi:uncharacterized membrane protein required for colicin V production
MDWVMIVLVLAFAVRGSVRGSVSQFFSLSGLLVGLWVAGWVSQWVGSHWDGARPAVVFWLLRWLVALLAGFAVVALFQWWGEAFSETVRKSSFAAVDRVLGFGVGALLGVVVTAFLMLGALRLRPHPGVERALSSARLAPYVLNGAVTVSNESSRWLPGDGWLGREFKLAERRLRARRDSESSPSGS